MPVIQNISKFIKNVPHEIKYIFALFIISRVILTIIGVSARIFAGSSHGEGMQIHFGNVLLDIWGAWDTGYYMYLAENWYSPLDLFSDHTVRTSFAFFPLYPLLMRCLGFIIDNNFYIAGLIISNISLIVACIYLYKLVRLDSDNSTALRSVKYLILFPAAFIFSGVFTESLFVALAIICFYYAKKEKWIYAGAAGFFLAITKILGIFIIIPLANEYLKNKSYKLNRIGKDVLPFLLIPAGFSLFSLYNYYLTGNFFIFSYALGSEWGRHISNPLPLLHDSVLNNIFYISFAGIFTIAAIFLFLIFTNKFKFSYWFFGMYSIFYLFRHQL